MISHRYRCIYVKVPKCGSTTVLDWFVMHGKGRHSMKPYWYGGLLSDRIQAVTRIMNLYPDYATFSFVRNPYERFVSLYLYLSRLAQGQAGEARAHPPDYGTLREFAELCRDVLSDFGTLWGREARDFFRAHSEREYGPGRVRLRHLGFVTGHARPQTDFVPDCHRERLFGVPRVNGDPLSFIGTVENMEADFRRLGDRLGLPAIALFERNSRGTGIERGGEYRAYYDDATRRLVEDVYAADLEFTGCGFEDGRTMIAVAVRATTRRRRAGTLLARAWHHLRSLEIGVEARVLHHAKLRRILRPLGRLRGLAGRGRTP